MSKRSKQSADEACLRVLELAHQGAGKGELLAVPDRSTMKGKRNYAILTLLVGCALRRRTDVPHVGRHADA